VIPYGEWGTGEVESVQKGREGKGGEATSKIWPRYMAKSRICYWLFTSMCATPWSGGFVLLDTTK